jgi:RNA-binding protein YlmH
MDERERLKKRFIELANRSYNSGLFLFTDFLGLDEQSVFSEAKAVFGNIPYKTFGGTEGAERIMVRFGDEEELSYSEPFPIVCIKAEPVSQKFAEKLTHRDFLGALMNLGIERSTLGDIPILDNVGYIFAKEDIAPFIMSELSRARHTDLKLSIVESLPEGSLYRTERRKIQAVGERLDAVIAKVFSLSRDEAQSLFSKRLVYTDGRVCENTSHIPKRGERISVRGHGRMIYLGYETTSKKGKLNIEVDVYV